VTKSYKWVGGIGYLLSFIPYVNVIAWIVVAIAWILMGRDTREKIFTATGILMIIAFALGVSFLALILVMLPSLALLMPGSMTGRPPLQSFKNLSHLMAFAMMGLILAGIAIVAAILEIISHFRAGRIFNNTWFKLAGWFRIFSIVAAVISIPLIIMSAANLAVLATTAPGPSVLASILSLFWPIIIVAIIALLSTIFSIVAFFTIPETEELSQNPETSI